MIAGKHIIARLKKHQITDQAVKTGENGKSGTPTHGRHHYPLVASLLLCFFYAI